MSQPTICFVAREDFVHKPGGDTVQWHIYEAAAKAAGMGCVTWFDDAPMPEADVFHALNVDRPLEVYPKMREAHRRGRPFILSTIHHPIPWLERLRKVEPPGGTLGRLLYRSPFGRTVAGAESVKEIVRLVHQRRIMHAGDLFPGWSARVRWLLEQANRVMLLAARETHHLGADFGVSLPPARTVVVPNWVEGVGEDRSCDTDALLKQWPEPPVLVVSRIEARKNVRRLAALVEQAQRPTLFLGKPNPNEPAYVQAFQDIVRGAKFARWVPGVPRPELSGYYRIGSFLLNGSYVEVSPMVDIESFAFGCPVATTRYAVHHELLPPGTPLCDAYDDADLLARLQWRPTRLEPTEVVSPERCRATLLETYRAVAEERR